MKVVLSTIPLQVVNPVFYKSTENKAIEYKGEVRFPINGLLAKTLKKDDEVKVVRIVTEKEVSEDISEEILKYQQEELDKINESIGAKISYEEVRETFKETSDIVQSRFRQIVGALENGCEIYADITYGPKTLTPVLFYALGFAEKFFDADIKNIVYGKAVFGKDKQPIPDASELFDVTPLYYLNSLTNVMTAPDGKTALERLDKFFEL
jgi:hypothetical protein